MNQLRSLLLHPPPFIPPSQVAVPISDYVPQCAPYAAARGRAVCAWGVTALAALALIGLVFAAPLLSAQGHAAEGWIVYRSFASLCHQIPERSFAIAGRPLAVCARCVGVYAGFAAGVLFYPLARSLRRTDAPARAWLFVTLAPTTVDFLLGVTGLWHNTHLSRAATGALAGAGAAFFVVPALVELARAASCGKLRPPQVNPETAAKLAVRHGLTRNAGGASAPVLLQSFNSGALQNLPRTKVKNR